MAPVSDYSFTGRIYARIGYIKGTVTELLWVGHVDYTLVPKIKSQPETKKVPLRYNRYVIDLF